MLARKEVLTICFILSFMALGFIVYRLDDLRFIRHEYKQVAYSTSIEMVKNDLIHTKLCITRAIRQTSSDLWSNLHKIINKCSSVNDAVKRPFIEATIDKQFIPYSKNDTQQECNVISLGIGDEVVMEERLKQIQPFCKFYGADPFPDTAEAYKKVGKVFITAVDTMNGEKVLSTLKSGSYSWNKVNVTSLGSFLKNDLQINKVHYFSMDVEGSEYRLLPYLTITGPFNDESDSAIICQFIAELHGYLPQYNYTELMFQDMFLYFLSASPYAPIKASKPYEHNYIVFMNVEEDYCLKLFYS